MRQLVDLLSYHQYGGLEVLLGLRVQRYLRLKSFQAFMAPNTELEDLEQGMALRPQAVDAMVTAIALVRDFGQRGLQAKTQGEVSGWAKKARN